MSSHECVYHNVSNLVFVIFDEFAELSGASHIAALPDVHEVFQSVHLGHLQTRQNQ